MEQTTAKVNKFDELKAAYVVAYPQTIREKLAAWAFDGDTDIEGVIRNLESVDCAASCSPAPVYYDDMAHEIGEHWLEIDDALSDYRNAIGEAWTPKPDQNFLTYLWFAYEWTARNLADAIREEAEAAD